MRDKDEAFDSDRPIVVVTGASGGIGNAIAQTIHKHYGAEIRLALHGWHAAERLQTIANDMPGAFVVKADLSQPGGPSTLVEAVLANGDICGLVNAAGIDAPHEPALNITEAALDLILTVNFKSPVQLMRDFGRAMAKGDGGVIVNVSTILTEFSLVGSAAYRASKAALESATLQFARELGPRGVRVNAVKPGFIATQMTATLTDELKQTLADRIPDGNFGEPEHIGQAVLSLMENEYINGAILTVDGGLLS